MNRNLAQHSVIRSGQMENELNVFCSNDICSLNHSLESVDGGMGTPLLFWMFMVRRSRMPSINHFSILAPTSLTEKEAMA